MKSVLDIRIICWRNLGEKYRIDTKNSLVNHAHHDRYAHIFYENIQASIYTFDISIQQRFVI